MRSFGEAESFFVSIKVIAIIILGLGAMFGLVSFDGKHKAILFTNLTAGAFPKGIVAGEMDNPKEAVLKAIKPMIGRLVIFFVLTIVVLASLLPMKEVGSSIAPFIDVFDKIGIPFAADIMNFVILTAILSAGNSGLYASSRMLWSLANEGMLSKRSSKSMNTVSQCVPSFVNGRCGLVTIFKYLCGRYGLSCLGINCSSPAVISGLLKRIRTVSPKPLETYPNSGEIYDGATQTWKSIPDNSHTLLKNSRAWNQLGAKIVGGSCRTSPEDIACLAQAFRE